MGENNSSGCSSDSSGPLHPLPTGSPSQTVPHHQYNAEYLSQLLKDKKQLTAFPNVFIHLERLVDEEIGKVRVSLFQFEFTKDDAVVLPEPVGQVETMQEKVYVPVHDFPDYNFVGRILGPRGMTAKQLETETGCKIMVRGKGSMRDKKKEEMNRGKPNWEHLSDELHVLVQCDDTPNRAKVKILRAVDEIKKLLVPSPEGEDELKRKQLMELAIINGTYRPANMGVKGQSHTPRLLAPMTLPSPLRSPTLGAPIILSPNRGGIGMHTPVSLHNGAMMTPTSVGLPNGMIPSSPTDLASATGLFFNSFPSFDPSQLAAYPYAAAAAAAAFGAPYLTSELTAMDAGQFGAILNQRRILGQAREHPYQKGKTSSS